MTTRKDDQLAYSQKEPPPPARADAIGLALISYESLRAMLEAAERRRAASDRPGVAIGWKQAEQRRILTRYEAISFGCHTP